MKKTIISVAVIALILLGILILPKSPSKKIPEANLSDSNYKKENVDVEKKLIESDVPEINFEITGFGPGKSHIGTFTNYQITDFKIDENKNPGSGKITIQSNSLDFGIEGLNKHLCAEEFLNCEIYPNISFNLTNFLNESENPNEYTAIGTLIFKDSVSVISFPVIKDGEKWSSDFRLNVKEIGVSYIGIDEEIQIKINTI